VKDEEEEEEEEDTYDVFQSCDASDAVNTSTASAESSEGFAIRRRPAHGRDSTDSANDRGSVGEGRLSLGYPAAPMSTTSETSHGGGFGGGFGGGQHPRHSFDGPSSDHVADAMAGIHSSGCRPGGLGLSSEDHRRGSGGGVGGFALGSSSRPLPYPHGTPVQQPAGARLSYGRLSEAALAAHGSGGGGGGGSGSGVGSFGLGASGTPSGSSRSPAVPAWT